MRAIHHGQFPSDRPADTESQSELQHLVDQMSGLARQIARFGAEDAEGRGIAAGVDAGQLRRIMGARRARAEFFNPGLFADPAWDMLLDLFAAHLTQVRVTVTSLCAASNVPTTTALRWIKILEDEGLASRHPDKFDGRRTFMELTNKGEQAMRRYFSSIEIDFLF